MNATTDALSNKMAAGVIGFFATSGVIINGGVALTLVKIGSGDQYNRLCISLAVGDCGVMSIFAIWATTMTITQSGMSVGFIGRKVGQTALLFQFGTLYSTLLIAINRFAAITSGVKYQQWFSVQKTKQYITAIWVISILHQIVYLFPSCDFYYDPTIWVWLFEESPCGHVIAFYIDLGYSVLILVIILSFNMATFYVITTARKKTNAATQAKTDAQKAANIDKRKKEIAFFIQSLINGGVFTFMFFSFHIISRFTTGKWDLFASTTLIWQLSHATNGVVILALNKKVRHYIKTQLGIKANNATAPVFSVRTVDITNATSNQ